jgi:ketosteroid isomerase-like protein
LEEGLEIFEDVALEAEEIIDGGEDRVIVVLRMTGRARLSGVEVELRFAVLHMLRDGRIVRGREYATKEESLEAARLSE